MVASTAILKGDWTVVCPDKGGLHLQKPVTMKHWWSRGNFRPTEPATLVILHQTRNLWGRFGGPPAGPASLERKGKAILPMSAGTTRVRPAQPTLTM